ncbi:MAG: DNA-3-methyladenine glycosylase I [Deltaproteobacteria bacterium]|nr:DNA-3-methyladenine glycosylase I [Deltaproteobacteria bacterium]MBN2670136.1 DNA-3-methyladenine glycosylase I [Deltaproteobacteria bacterium]
MTDSSARNSIRRRCDWCGDDPEYMRYHDTVWGVPVYDDRRLFEFLVLESAQAGLSWITILRRQPGYQAAFENFDVHKVAAFTSAEIEHRMADPRIIRNRKKIESAVHNAARFIEIQKEFGSFSNYYWQFSKGAPIQNRWHTINDIPATTPLSHQISNAMRKKGFQFIGPTVMYAYMQATGMVNDHLVTCFRHSEVKKAAHK